MTSSRYHFADGLRHVLPYQREFACFVKRRWVGRNLIDVLVTEFAAFDETHFRSQIDNGGILLDEAATHAGAILRENQRLTHCATLTEPAVADRQIRILSSSPQLLAVDKPAGIVVHPGGGYYWNSLQLILTNGSRFQDGKVAPPLFPLHRIDRLSSGVVIFARTPTAAKAGAAAMRANSIPGAPWGFRGCPTHTDMEVRKIYVARVEGNFGTVPECPNVPGVTRALEPELAQLSNSRVAGMWIGPRPAVLVVGVVERLCRKAGTYKFTPPEFESIEQRGFEECPGKLALTVFVFLRFDAARGESVVLCRPLTGRSHQIRCQLKWLGHPISNDVDYSTNAEKWMREQEDTWECHPTDTARIRDSDVLGLDRERFEYYRCIERRDVCGRTKLQPSGIFLHSLVYSLPSSIAHTLGHSNHATLEFESSWPSWAFV